MARLRPLLVLLVGLLLGYGLIVLLFWSQQRALLFHPAFTRAPDLPPDFELPVEGAVLRGWVVNPGQPLALLYFGGNAEDVSRFRADAARLFPASTVYLVAYRGFGRSSGEPSEATLVADALALFDHVAGQHAAVDALGRSLGAGVAVQLAAARPLRRLGLVTPFDSVDRVGAHHYPWLPVRWLARDRFDSLAHAPGVEEPVLVVVAGQDLIVPPAHAERLLAALPRPARVLRLEAAGHNDVQEFPGFDAELAEFFAAEVVPDVGLEPTRF